MRDLLDRAAARGAVVTDEPELAARALRERADRAACALAAWGVRPGDRAALVLPNGPDWFVVHLALARLGVLTVPVTT
ncbi:MAG: AMP-binding protein, partial [Actinomycetota bacterium]|nr:AMP-binding protein [Actinomycetota bacterium]